MFMAQTCPACGRSGAVPCRRCFADRPLLGALPAPEPLTTCTALLDYDPATRAVVTAIKYRGQRGQLAWLARGLADLVGDPAISGVERLHVVTWAPTSTGRRRRRGFDQAELLARAVARGLRVPARALLARDPGRPQTGRTLAERAAGPRFRLVGPVQGLEILVVDDVVTTGATLAAAGRTLRAGGSGTVHGAALTHPR